MGAVVRQGCVEFLGLGLGVAGTKGQPDGHLHIGLVNKDEFVVCENYLEQVVLDSHVLDFAGLLVGVLELFVDVVLWLDGDHLKWDFRGDHFIEHCAPQHTVDMQ